MMSEFKMSDYFDKPVGFVGDTIKCPDFAYATTTCEWEVNGVDYGHAIAHAINNHDKLVEENQRITEIATKHATRADELYEALECVCSYLSEDGLITTGLAKEIVNAQRVLNKPQIDAVSNSKDD